MMNDITMRPNIHRFSFIVHCLLSAIVEVREHDPPGLGLIDTRDGRRDLLADQPAGILDHNHSAVIEERDALLALTPDIADRDLNILPRHDRRAYSVGELVEAQDLDALQAGDTSQVI